MSPIQHGIQSAHGQMELFIKYKTQSEKKDMLFDWADWHKTMIVLNAGYDITMHEVKTFLDNELNPYPWAYFNESTEAMNGMLTNIALILPEKIYQSAALLRMKRISFTEISSRDNPLEYEPLVFANINYTEEETSFINSACSFSEYEIELINMLNKFNLA